MDTDKGKKCLMTDSDSLNGKKFKCEHCGSKYQHPKSLKRHVKNCPRESGNSRGTMCLVKGCDTLFYHKVKMYEHLEQFHQLRIEKEYPGPFSSMSDFLQWKENMEKMTYSAFTKQTSEKSGKYIYYVCQYDGSGKPHRLNSMIKTSRRNKKGQAKSGATCLARICVKVDAANDINVTFYKYHNHVLGPASLQHQPMFQSDKKEIAAKIDEGVPIKVIHQQLRSDIVFNTEEVDTLKLERKHLISLGRLSSQVRRLKAAKQQQLATNS